MEIRKVHLCRSVVKLTYLIHCVFYRMRFLSVCRTMQVLVVLLCFSPMMAGHSWTVENDLRRSAHHNQLGPGKPFFDDIAFREVEATLGRTLLLPCTVRHLGDKVVSWIRSRDLHILTSGPFTFTGDNRFESVPSPAGDFWGLRIRGVLATDAGQYECQVNTDPKMSLAINLTVSEVASLKSSSSSHWIGKAMIRGPRQIQLREGSQVQFTCEISPIAPKESPLQYGGVLGAATRPRVRWLHDGQEILFDTITSSSAERLQHQASRRRISVDNHSGSGEMNWKMTSILKIEEVTWRDSGQYTCLQMSGKPDTVRLIVVEGEHPEAMQRDVPVLSRAARTSYPVPVALCFNCFWIITYLELCYFCK